MLERITTATGEYFPVEEDQRYLDSFLGSIQYLSKPDFLEAHATAVFMMKSYRDAGKGPRDDGSPWCSHSLATGEIVAGYQVNLATIQKGLLHDINEDANMPFEQIASLFGDDVADGIARLSKLKQEGITYDEKDEILQANLFEAVIDNPGAAFVRICERLHNLQTIEARFKKDQGRARATCEETLGVYVPLAWRLGLYDIANEMVIHSLSLLHPQEMKRLEQIIPAFSDNHKTNISRMISDATQLDDKHFRIYLPSYGELAQALIKSRSFEKINPDDIHQIVDIHIENRTEAYLLLLQLAGSGWFDTDWYSLQDFWTALSRGENERPQYITLRTKSTGQSGESISIRINFLTANQIREKQAAIFHLIQTESEEDTQMKALAQVKIEKERGELKRLKLMAPTAQVRARLYEASLARGVMVATIAFHDGRIEQVDAFNRSTVLDVLLQAVHSGKLSFDVFKRIREVKIGARRAKLYQTVEAMSNLFINIHPNASQLRPGWLRALSTTITEHRKILYQELRRLIVEENRSDIKKEAEELGEAIIAEEFRREQHVVLRLKVKHGFDPHLTSKYPDESEFLVAAGIGEIDPTVIHAVVNRIGEYRKSLVHITVFVPRGFDKYGWEATCAEIFLSHKINIAESSNGQSSRSGVDAFLSYCFEQGEKNKDELIQFARLIAANCKNIFDLPELPKVEVMIPPTLNER